jgi:uncharacterized protein DUF3617
MNALVHTNRAAVLLCLSFTLIAATALHAADRMQVGKWEYKITTNGRSSTVTRCVSTEEAASVNGDTRSARASAAKTAKNCVLNAYDVEGNTVTFRMDCGGTILDSTATYHGDSSVGVVKSTTAGKQSTTFVNARRLGACS